MVGEEAEDGLPDGGIVYAFPQRVRIKSGQGQKAIGTAFVR